MGIRSWIQRRVRRGKDARCVRIPRFELLEARNLLSGEIGMSGPSDLSVYPQVDQAICVDLCPGCQAPPQCPVAASDTETTVPQNHAPTAKDDMYSTTEDRGRTVAAPGVLLNDQDLDGDPLTVVQVTDPGHGQLTLESNGSFVYRPEANWFGTDSFTYKVNDGQADSNVATVFLPVGSANDAPSFTPGPDPVVLEDSGPQTFYGWATAISAGPADESGQTVRFAVTCDRPTLFSAQPVLRPDGTLTFTPAPDACGQGTVAVQRIDDGGTANGGLDTSLLTFTITIVAENDAPVLKDSESLWLSPMRQDQKDLLGTLVKDILASAGDNRIQDADPGAVEGIAVIGANSTWGTWEFSTNNGFTWRSLGSPSPSVARLLAADAETRIRFVPRPGFSGRVDCGITFRAWDQTSGSNGDTASARDGGGSRAFSTATETAGVVVNPAVRLPVGGGSNGVTVYCRGDHLLVVNTRRQVLFDGLLGSFDQLVIVGADNKSDTVTVDLGAGASFMLLPEGLLFEGGLGRQTDTLVLRGTADSDFYEVHADLVLISELLALFDGVEQIRLEGRAGDDAYMFFGLGVPVLVSETSGIDTLSFSYASSALTIDLNKARGQWQQVLAGGANMALKGTFENVMGTTWSDVIRGNGAHNRIWGWGGDDTIYGGAGNDWLFGGAGRDRLSGDAGHDVLVGGAGADELNAGAGKNLLIGGLGDDSLKGGSSEDILVGGTTQYDEDGTALQAIMTEWTARRSFATRIDHLSYGWGLNGQYVLWLGRTVLGDSGTNVHYGGSGCDWFLSFGGDSLIDRGSKDR